MSRSALLDRPRSSTPCRLRHLIIGDHPGCKYPFIILSGIGGFQC